MIYYSSDELKQSKIISMFLILQNSKIKYDPSIFYLMIELCYQAM